MDATPARIALLLENIEADVDHTGPREWIVRVPSARRGAVTCGLVARERTLLARAFVMRGPDRAHDAFYRRALRKNLDTHQWRFALDPDGDLLLLAQLPLPGLTAELLDELLGALSVHVDESYEGLVRTGFHVPADTEFGTPPA